MIRTRGRSRASRHKPVCVAEYAQALHQTAVFCFKEGITSAAQILIACKL